MQSAGRMLKQWERWLAVGCLCAVLLAGAIASTPASGAAESIGRSRVYKFRHITSAQGQEFLSQLKIGQGYNQLTKDVLIVTSGSSTDLIRASEVFSVLDQERPAQIRVLLVKTDDQELPNLEAFVVGLRNITAGPMTDAPPRNSDRPAIVDIHDNKLIAIGAEDVLADLEKAVALWKKEHQKEKEEAAKIAELNKPAKPLAEVAAELFKIQSATQVKEPNSTELMKEALESEVETEADFLALEMLKALNQAEQEKDAAPAVPTEAAKAAQEAASKADAVVKTEQPAEPATTDVAQDDDPMAKLRALLMQSKKDEQAAIEAAKAVEATKAAEDAAPSDLQSDIEQTRKRLAELEAIASAKQVSKIQTKPQIDPLVGEDDLAVIDLPQEVMLESLVELVGKQLELNYMYDPTLLKAQKVQLKIHNGKIKVKDIYALLESVLRFKGFVMTRRGNLVTIVKATDAAAAAKLTDVTIRYPDDPIPPGDVIVGTIFELDYISTESAKNMLIKMGLGLGGASAFQEVPETGTLIVTDYAYRMDRVAEVLAMVDIEGEERKFQYRKLQYMTPEVLVPKLTELAGQLEDIALQVNAGAKAPAAATRTVTKRDPKTGRPVTTRVPASTPTAAANKPAQKNTVYIDTDDRTNRILMVGTEAQINLVNGLVDTLDVPKSDLRYVKEYVIQYVEAMEVVDVLNELGLAQVNVTSPSNTQTTNQPTRTTTGRTPTRTPTPPRNTSQSSASAPSGATETSISVRPATNSLLVNAIKEQHEAIELVIVHVDVVQKDQRTIREYEIQYVDTQEIMDTMVDLGLISAQQSSSNSGYSSSSRQTGRPTGRTSATNRGTQPPAGNENPTSTTSLLGVGGDEKSLTSDEPQISILEATNSMLVYATPRQHDAIALLIAHADRTPDRTTTPYVIYALENQDPVELAEVLNKLIQETVEQTGKTSGASTSATGAKIQTKTSSGTASAVPTLEEETIRVIPDEMSYSLIVYANKRNQQWVSELIKELDEYRPQVLLDCTLVEITKDDAFNYSIDLIAKTYGGSSVQSGSPVGKGEGGVPLYGDFSQRTLSDIQSIGGTVTGFFNSEMIQGVLETVQTNGYGRIMAQPKILVNDNEEGEIKTENTTSIAQQSSSTIPGTGGSDPIISEDVKFSPYSEGVTLNIKPHISKGDMLRLDMTLSRTDFTVKDDVTVAGKTYPRPPDLLTTDVKTIATVPDGTTIILGGLEAVDQTKSQNKVPILGDLPLIGLLFRGVNNSDSENRLYVFVKANIIRPGDQAEGLEDIRRVSEKYREDFEEMEAKFQDLQDFPGIKPPPMAPKKVLDEDDFERRN